MLRGAGALADADFYVPLAPQAIATLESEPHCNPRDTGDTERTRSNPFGQRQEEVVHRHIE